MYINDLTYESPSDLMLFAAGISLFPVVKNHTQYWHEYRFQKGKWIVILEENERNIDPTKQAQDFNLFL